MHRHEEKAHAWCFLQLSDCLDFIYNHINSGAVVAGLMTRLTQSRLIKTCQLLIRSSSAQYIFEFSDEPSSTTCNCVCVDKSPKCREKATFLMNTFGQERSLNLIHLKSECIFYISWLFNDWYKLWSENYQRARCVPNELQYNEHGGSRHPTLGNCQRWFTNPDIFQLSNISDEKTNWISVCCLPEQHCYSYT